MRVTSLRSRLFFATALASVTTVTTGCDSQSDGTLRATVYGEEFIEEGIPADDFVDGWEAKFDSFIVTIGALQAAPAEGAGVSDPAAYMVDLSKPSNGKGVELALIKASGNTYKEFSYELAGNANAVALNVEAADAATMKGESLSMWIRAKVSKGGVTKQLNWKFASKISFGDCEIDAAVDGNTKSAQATIHSDHLFYDDAVSETPNVAFDALAAADRNNDNEVTLAELDAVDIRGFARYQVGSLPITNLGQYVRHMVTTVGHIDGEGHCAKVTVK